MEWDRELYERNIPDVIRTGAINYVRQKPGNFAPLGQGSGRENQRIISLIGCLMTMDLFDMGKERPSAMADRPLENTMDVFDFQIGKATYHVRSTGSVEYRDHGEIRGSWDILIPEVQWQQIQHDYYIYVVLNSLQALHATKCGWLCACVKKAIEWTKAKPIDPTNPKNSREKEPVLVRMVPAKWTFPVQRLLPGKVEA